MKISVALCTYNGEKYIREQLESILAQTYKVDEVVISDDCSMDNTIEIIRNIESRTDIPIYIHRNNTNIGFIRNFEKAVSLCKGDTILLSDQDDIWYPDKVESIINWFYENPDKEVLFTDADLIDENGEYLKSTLWQTLDFNRKIQEVFDNGMGYEIFYRDNIATGATMAFRGEIYKTFSSYCKYAFHDEAICFIALNDDKLGYCTKKTIKYRIHGSQVCGIGVIGNSQSICYKAVNKPISDRLIDLPLSHRLIERKNFIEYRKKAHTSPFGVFKVIIKWKKFFKMYKKYAFEFMKYDIRQNLINITTKMKSIFANKC